MISQTKITRHAKAKEIFFAATTLDAAECAEFLRVRCADDAKLLREVESLLAMRVAARDFLESSALEAVSPSENLKNEIIGGYRLLGEIGAGGMGVVFLAEKDDAEFHRRVALKIVRSNLRSPSIRKRFNLERQILNRLEHPNIARLLDGGTSRDGLPYFVMEYVEGAPLVAYAAAKKLSLAERLALFRQVCAAVSFAHRHAVIHRDLKPSNILVTEDGTTKLLDFGIAKLLSADGMTAIETAATIRAMTPEYASPEQIKGETVTTGTDVYSLGVILYELLTGTLPYQTDSENINEIIRAVCEVEPSAPSRAWRDAETQRRRDTEKNHQVATDISATPTRRVSASQLKGDLDNIILKALRKEPLRRYSSVEAFSEDLRRHLDGLPVTARRDTFAYRAEKFIRRNRLTVVIAVLGILALIGGAAAAIWQARRAERERTRAERRFAEVRLLANSFMFELNDEILKGQTQGRELVVKRALEYLDRLAGEAKDDQSLQRELATAYLKIGDIQGKPYSPNLGDSDGALESYGKAVTMLETLHRADSADLEIRRDLVLAYSGIVALQSVRMFRKTEAMQNLRNLLPLSESLVAAAPADVQYRRMLADVYRLIGDTLENYEQKIAMHEKSLELREELLRAEPSSIQDRVAVASAHQRIGVVLKSRASKQKDPQDNRAALESFDKSLAIYEELATAEPGNSRHRRNVADMTAMRMPMQAILGDANGAMNGYRKALQIFEDLAAADPKNVEARFDVALTHEILCRTFMILGDVRGAEDGCRRARKVGEAVVELDPTNSEARRLLVAVNNIVADTFGKSGDRRNRLKYCYLALAAAEQWAIAEPLNSYGLDAAKNIANEIGMIHIEIAEEAKNSPRKAKENWQTARRWFERSLAILKDLQNRNNRGKDYADTIGETERRISRCDAALDKISSSVQSAVK